MDNFLTAVMTQWLLNCFLLKIAAEVDEKMVLKVVNISL